MTSTENHAVPCRCVASDRAVDPECSECNGFGWKWSDGVAPTLCPQTHGLSWNKRPLPCGRGAAECRGCGRSLSEFPNAFDVRRTQDLNRLLADLDTLALISKWQAATFPSPTLRGAMAHLQREVFEADALAQRIIAGVDSGEARTQTVDDLAEELADIVFLCVQASTVIRRDLDDSLVAKLKKNMARKWKAPDAAGVIEHVKEPSAVAVLDEDDGHAE